MKSVQETQVNSSNDDPNRRGGNGVVFSVGNDGRITGGFDNGLTRTIGQVALANFSNVMRAVRTFAAPWGMGISARKIQYKLKEYAIDPLNPLSPGSDSSN